MKTLYRPIGEKELILIAKSDFKKFPSRLEWQPIFYPVLNEEYAIEIASKWNTKDEFGNYLGFVTEFKITDEEFDTYEIQNVGAIHHNELWVPANKLADFNKAILGKIKVTKVFIGDKFKSPMDNIISEIIEKLQDHEINEKN
ncbi:MAG: ADP-ribosylation/crystallin J1 [Bacteroidota bacterium]